MTSHPPTRRLTVLVTIALSLGVLIAALLGPAQTLAQTRKVACPTSTVRAKAKREGRTCTKTHKGKGHKTKRPKHATKKAPKAGSPATPATVAAQCEDGSAPVLSASETFSCTDGSEPACADGATPMPSDNGESLLCPVATEAEPGSSETECEEEGVGCSADTSPGSDEQTCEASASDSSSFVCEAED
ncbi:MAG: hypothetical protein ABSB69_13010 [Solirubrobacteraceae bacterium]